MYETKRLRIKLSTKEDALAIHKILKDEETMKYFTEGTYTFKQVEEFIENDQSQQKHYSVFLKDTNELIGKMTFSDWFMTRTYEIGWIFNKSHTNKGYCTEAAQKLLDVGFNEMNLHRIIATADPRNISSIKVMKKCNMRKEGTFTKSIHYKDDIWWDEVHYGILKEDY